MALNNTPVGERIHIGFFGCRNVGKSSLVNAITNQDLSVVSDIKGTTTDPVKKSMELLPLGPVIIIDTPGFDDEGVLGEKRIEKTKKILRSCDIAVLVTTAERDLNEVEKNLISIFEERKIPFIIAKNKSDILAQENKLNTEVKNKLNSSEKDAETMRKEIYVSAINKIGIEDLKNALGSLSKSRKNKLFLGDLIKPKDIVVLVTPIDSAAPKGRMIMPQQLAIRDIIDANGISVVTKESELKETLQSLNKKPALVVTDSQVFEEVDKIVPRDIPLTSFSILMARYKGFLETAIDGVNQISKLKNASKVLISEGCTHHRQCDDIGTVKLPNWLKKYTNLDLDFEWSSGTGFPNDLKKYDLIIHCGGCMLNENEMIFRMNSAENQNVPFTNYGIAIAYMKGILERSIKSISM